MNLTKAFDTVSRKGLWLIMERLCFPSKFLRMVIQMHKDQRSKVRLNSDLSGSFPIVNGVKQGCVLTPTLFSIFFSMMLKQIIEEVDDDGAVYIHYRLQETACPHENTWAAVSGPPLHWRRCFCCCLHRKSPVTPNFLLCRGFPALRTRGQLEKYRGPSPAYTPRRVPLSPHHHHRKWAESSSSVILSGVHHRGLACPTSALSAISMPAVDMDSPLHKSSFTKSNQEGEKKFLDQLCFNKNIEYIFTEYFFYIFATFFASKIDMVITIARTHTHSHTYIYIYILHNSVLKYIVVSIYIYIYI